MNKEEQALADYLKLSIGKDLSLECLKLIHAVKQSGMREAMGIIKYWQDGHKNRLRMSPGNEFIKCEIQDLQELLNHMSRSQSEKPL